MLKKTDRRIIQLPHIENQLKHAITDSKSINP